MDIVKKIDALRAFYDSGKTLSFSYRLAQLKKLKKNIIKNEKKFVELWVEMPKQYQYDFRIFEIRCQFLQGNNQALIAKDYINEFKKVYKSNQEVLSKIVKIEKHAKTPSNKEKIVIEKTSSKE